MNADLDFAKMFKQLLPVLRRVQPYVYGLALIGVFAYTSYVVNEALNVKVTGAEQVSIQPLPKITFDKATIESVKKLNVVGGEVPLGDLGRNDPFR